MPQIPPRAKAAVTDLPVLGLRERKKAKTKAAIQDHALRLFKEQGYAQTTVEEIAAAAEVSPSTFFRYFATKDETVLTDLVDTETFQMMIDAPEELSPIQALQYAVRRTFQEMPDDRLQLELTRNVLIQSVPELRKGMMAEITRPIELLTEAVAVRSGRAVDDPDVRLYAGAAVGALMTVATQRFEDDPRAAITDLQELIGRLDRVIHLPED
ncbi:TetR family transcriptional regulator [Lapillicoccus sp.]|uniref:TetR/AcrR family transcriptional regulator n=1 Tax=Lapillicoccus sp. TaxID=1909287 RepID=UPI003266FB50